MSLCFLVVLLANSLPGTYAYVDFGTETLISPSYFDPTPIPHQLPTDLRQEVFPSMITAVSPTITIAPNGTREMLYSLHYHDLFKRTREGRGVFKRGVFADDPPFSTCRQCGGDNSASGSSTTTSSCTVITYHVSYNGNLELQSTDCYLRASFNFLIRRPQPNTVMIRTMKVFSNHVQPIRVYPAALLSPNPA